MDAVKTVEPESSKSSKTATVETITPILIISCAREQYLKRCLDSLIKYVGKYDTSRYPIFLSNGCPDNFNLVDALRGYMSNLTGLFIYQPDEKNIRETALNSYSSDTRSISEENMINYHKLSEHYKVALDWVFSEDLIQYDVITNRIKLSPDKLRNIDSVIILEDDLEISADFMEYFIATMPILKSDPTLFCVSAWNDNGRSELINIQAPEKLYRTDYFPGLGWMMLKSFWSTIRKDWPLIFWDDKLRSYLIQRKLQCIRPEISRVTNFGSLGVSSGMYFMEYISPQYKHDAKKDFVRFSKFNLSYLRQPIYDQQWTKLVDSAKVTDIDKIPMNSPKPIKVYYNSFKDIPLEFNLFPGVLLNVPRTSYRLVVPFYYKNSSVLLCPISRKKKQDPVLDKN